MSALTTPTFADFTQYLIDEIKRSVEGSEVQQGFRTIVVKKPNSQISTFSLDKLYRFYVDDIATHPDFTQDELTSCLMQFINKFQNENGRDTLFKISEIKTETPCVLEQCCIR